MAGFEDFKGKEVSDVNLLRIESLISRAELDDDLQMASRLALEFYENLPYHNLNHALEVAEKCLEIADEEGLTRNERMILLLAALWHDAYFGEPLQEGELSKEHRSARLAYEAITMTSADDKYLQTSIFAQEVQSTILATNVDSGPGSKLGIILNTADLENIYSEDKIVMLKATGALYIEKLYLEGNFALIDILASLDQSKDEVDRWVFGARDYVNRLITKKLDPTGLPAIKALSNLKFMTAENLMGIFTKE